MSGARERESIEVVIHPDGSVTVEAFGYRGSSCEEATAFLEQALGVAVSKKRKPEYYQKEGRISNVRSSTGR